MGACSCSRSYQYQKVSNPHTDQLKILHSCCLFCIAAYDKNVKDDKQLTESIKATSTNFIDWCDKGNRSISFITEMNVKSLNLNHTIDPVRVLVMSVRGTSNFEEGFEDIKSYKPKPVEDDEKKECFFAAGAGFIEAYNDIKQITFENEKMLEVFSKMASDHCSGRVLIVGHSLGGTVAQAMASELSLIKPDFKIAVVTFGQPRFFTTESASKDWKFEHWRVINEGDPVPTLPPRDLNFTHHGKAFHFNTNNNGRWNIIEDYPDFDGLDGPSQVLKYNIPAHIMLSNNGYLARLASAIGPHFNLYKGNERIETDRHEEFLSLI
mmetsp:Transcript_20502/g.28237  ORF Transcript_20502/g.28237 Transcript_20502/m.28237 type:complete len:323 (+) Transcript_20502:44-1012(+)